jgi:hypothetical protein
MAFFKDSDAVLPVVWYFVPNDRETLPFATVFASRIYERDEEPQEHLGERYAPVPWRGGQAPGPVPKCGKCGSADAWANGVLITDPFPQTYPGTNVPLCCCPPDPQFFGQAAHGGIIATPFRGEAAGGGILFEPFHGEAAGGGSFVASNLFQGEGAGGGTVVEPFGGEASGGGVFAVGEFWYGGSAGGGDFIVGVEFDGGSAGGGDFVATHESVTIPGWTPEVRKTLLCIVTSVTGISCLCFSGASCFVTYNSSSVSWKGVLTGCTGGADLEVQYDASGGGWFLYPHTRTGGCVNSFASLTAGGGPGTMTLGGNVTLSVCCTGSIHLSFVEYP